MRRDNMRVNRLHLTWRFEYRDRRRVCVRVYGLRFITAARAVRRAPPPVPPPPPLQPPRPLPDDDGRKARRSCRRPCPRIRDNGKNRQSAYIYFNSTLALSRTRGGLYTREQCARLAFLTRRQWRTDRYSGVTPEAVQYGHGIISDGERTPRIVKGLLRPPHIYLGGLNDNISSPSTYILGTVIYPPDKTIFNSML